MPPLPQYLPRRPAREQRQFNVRLPDELAERVDALVDATGLKIQTLGLEVWAQGVEHIERELAQRKGRGRGSHRK